MTNEELFEKVSAWIESQEGKEALKKCLEDSDRIAREYKELLRVDWWRLLEPMTI